MAPTDEQIRLAIAQQAAEWFVAHRTGSLGEEGRAGFAAWLKASPVHLDEYLRMAAIWGELRTTAQDPRLPIEAWIAEAISEARSSDAPNAVAPASYRGAAKVVPLGAASMTNKERGAGRCVSGWCLDWALRFSRSRF